MESLRLFGRIAVAGVVVVVLMVALLLVRSLVSERAQFRDEAVARVGASRAGEQVLTGPLRVIPWTEQQLRVDEQGGQRMRTVHGHELQMPQQLQVDGQLLPEQRRVGMFKVPVYTWRGKLAARFAAFEPASVPGRVYGKPYLVMGIADVRGVVGTPVLQLDGRRALLQAGTQGLHDSIGGVHVPLVPDEAGRLPASALQLELALDGTRSLALLPVADDNRVQLVSSWPHPSFGGAFAPARREVGEGGFSASWAVSSLASKAQDQLQQAIAHGQGMHGEQIQVSLVDPVDVYTQALRAAKYGVLFIVLTFVGFGIYDLVKGLNLHPLQYLLVGLALVMFFLLLLSLSEQLPFVLAYLVASAACIALQAWYLSGVLRSWPRALGFAAMLTALYAALYGLLVSEQNALLLGSLLLFAVLAAVMGLTRRLDWRQLGRSHE